MSSHRKNIMLGTAGHVDHGKSALVKLLTGCETDTLAEEKQRGLTIDLGFAPCRLADDRVVGVVDVPGHVDFIRNMVAGAHGLDVVILVVAADDGIMPQTLEHLHILTLMGVSRGLVALTKIDLVDTARQNEVEAGLRHLLGNTFLSQAPICPLSNVTGKGFDRFYDHLNEIVNQCEDRPCRGIFRLWIEDVFTIRGSGTVITGIPSSGMVRLEDSLQLLPDGFSGHVRRMQVYGENASEGRAGECVALNVPELDHTRIRRGMLLSASSILSSVSMAEAELQLLVSLRGAFKDYFEVHLHVGTASVVAHVAMLDVPQMAPGEKQMVQLRLAEPLPLAIGERFVVRANTNSSDQNGLTTIGGGRILGLSNTRLRRHKPWTLELLIRRREALNDPAQWMELMARENQGPILAADLQRLTFLGKEEADSLINKLRSEKRLLPTPNGMFLHPAVLQEATHKILNVLQQFHVRNPQRIGLDREDLCKATACAAELFNLAIHSLLEAKRLVWNGSVFSQADWKAQIPNPEEHLSERVKAIFAHANWTPPTASELSECLRLSLSQAEKIIRLLSDQGVLVRLDEKIIMHRDAVEAAQKKALHLFAHQPSFTTMEFRDALGVSRKFAVPLLDYLDRKRFTVRSGHNRTPGVEAKSRMRRDIASL